MGGNWKHLSSPCTTSAPAFQVSAVHHLFYMQNRILFPLSENTWRSTGSKILQSFNTQNHFSPRILHGTNSSAKTEVQKQQTSATCIIHPKICARELTQCTAQCSQEQAEDQETLDFTLGTDLVWSFEWIISSLGFSFTAWKKLGGIIYKAWRTSTKFA